jgi:hypothetical protein
MLDRVYASVFYIALIVGSSWVAVSVGEALTRQALTRLSLVRSSDPQPSRIDNFLAAQERPSQSMNRQEPLIPAANAAPLGTLAKAMDEAETAVAEPDAETQVKNTAAPKLEAETVDDASRATDPAVNPIAPKPRVAGWMKRMSKRDASSDRRDETSARIIMRSLRAEM